MSVEEMQREFKDFAKKIMMEVSLKKEKFIESR
jgi:hypothetical protein